MCKWCHVAHFLRAIHTLFFTMCVCLCVCVCMCVCVCVHYCRLFPCHTHSSTHLLCILLLVYFVQCVTESSLTRHLFLVQLPFFSASIMSVFFFSLSPRPRGLLIGIKVSTRINTHLLLQADTLCPINKATPIGCYVLVL